MSASPRVSVIMGAYNCASTVAASIESILGQGYRDFEFVICDDGSSDATPEILHSYAERDDRVVVIRNEVNHGLSRSLNRCIETARGEYLARMDGDDVSREDRLGRQVRFLDDHPEYAFCGCSVALFDSGGVWGKIDYPEIPEARSFLLRSPFAHPTVMFRASCFEKAGCYDCGSSIGRSEDYDLFMRLYAKGLRGYNIPDYLFEYREELLSYRRRRLRYAFTEAWVRYQGFRRLGLLPYGLPFVAKPILVGLLPKSAYTKMRKALFK